MSAVLAIGLAFNLSTSEALFLGAILTATSVSISAQTLRELGRLRSREGTTILAAAVIDDVMGIIVLAFVFAATGGGDPLVSIGKMAIFLPVAFVLGQRVLAPWPTGPCTSCLTKRSWRSCIGLALGYGWAAEHLGGVAAVTGAYMAGLIASQTEHGREGGRRPELAGLQLLYPDLLRRHRPPGELCQPWVAPLLVLALLGVAVVSKIGGCYVGGRVAGSTTGIGSHRRRHDVPRRSGPGHRMRPDSRRESWRRSSSRRRS